MVLRPGNCFTFRAVRPSIGVARAVLVFAFAVSVAANTVVADTHAEQPMMGNPPDGVGGNQKEPEFWWNLSKDSQGRTAVSDGQAGPLVQPSGQRWRIFQTAFLPRFGTWALAGICAALGLFLMVKGRIRIQAGFSENTILRFGLIERFAHWLLALSFLVLAITGLNILFGRDVVKSLVGYIAFAKIAYYGKVIHNFTSYAFIAGLILVVVLWIRELVPLRFHRTWLTRSGGEFSSGDRPKAQRFHTGQRIFIWFLIITGALMSYSGICLIFPYSFAPFSDVFAVLNLIGFGLPSDLSALQELQLAHVWHGVIAIIMIVVVVGHIYLGSVGIEGAIDAVTSGQIDENLARQHYSNWVAELDLETPPDRIRLPEFSNVNAGVKFHQTPE